MQECYTNTGKSPQFNNRRTVQTLCLIMTEQCNLRCKYCYIKQCPEIITKEVMDQTITFALDIIKKEPDKRINLDLFGGEAMIEEEKVRYIIEQVEQRVPKEILDKHMFNVAIFTNATLLTKDFLEFTFKRPFVRFNFSIDGGKASHDATRVYASGKGSYDTAMEGLKLFAEVYKCKVSNIDIRWTVSPDNVQYLYESAKELLNNGAKSITPFPIREGWTEESLKVLDEQLKLFNDMFIKNIDNHLYCRCFFSTIVMESAMGNPKQFCKAGTNHIAISPKGLIYPCQRFYTNRKDQFIMGDIFKGIDTNSKWNNFFKSYTANVFPKCANCKLINSSQCEGQCIAAMFEQTGSLTEILESACKAHEVMRKHARRSHEILKDHPIYRRFLERERQS